MHTQACIGGGGGGGLPPPPSPAAAVILVSHGIEISQVYQDEERDYPVLPARVEYPDDVGDAARHRRGGVPRP